MAQPNTVQIGCKLPHGIWLEIVEPGPMNFPKPAGRRVKLDGAYSVLFKDKTSRVLIPNTLPFAVTTVDREFWDAWYERNKELDFVRNGAVFVAESANDARSIAKEHKDVKTGFEPINPEKDVRMGSVTRAPEGPKPVAME